MFYRLDKDAFERATRMSSVGRSVQVCLQAASPQAKHNMISITIIRGCALSGGEVSA